MFSQQLADYIAILGDVLTPPGQNVGSKEVKISTFSFAALLSGKIIEKNNFPQDTNQIIGYIIATNFFTNSLSTGVLKNNYNAQNEQVVFSSCSLIQYYKEICNLFSLWEMFTTNYLQVITEIIQGNKDLNYLEQTSNEFVSYLSSIQIFSKIIQLETNTLPPEFGIEDLDSKIESFAQKGVHFLQECDKLRVQQGSINFEQQQNLLTKELKELSKLASDFNQTYDSYQKQIKSNFNPLFNSQSYYQWEQYCSNIAGDISSILFLSYKIAENDPSQFLNVIQYLQQIVDQTFQMINPYMRALRSRGNFNECQLKSRSAYEKLVPLFTPLLDILKPTFAKCPEPIIGYYQSKATELFNRVQYSISEYNLNVKSLVASMKSDPKLAEFTSVNEEINNLKTETTVGSGNFAINYNKPNTNEAPASTVKKTVEVPRRVKRNVVILSNFQVPNVIVNTSFELSSLLLKQDIISFKDLNEKYNLLIEEFNKFSPTCINVINELLEVKEKTCALQHYDYILSNIKKFSSEIKLFPANRTNIQQIKVGILCSLVYLAFESLNSKNEGTLNSDFRKALSEALRFNISNLIEIQQLMTKNYQELQQSNNKVILYLADHINVLIDETQKVFQMNTDLNNPNCLGNCIHQFDKLQYLFYPLSAFIETDGNSEQVKDFGRSVSEQACILKNLTDLYRLSIQINVTNLFNDYYLKMKKFVEGSSNKAELEDIIYQIECELENAPPFSIFNYKFLVKIKNLFNSVNQFDLRGTDSSIHSVSSSLNSILGFIDEIDYSKNLVIPQVIGQLFNIAKNDVVQNTVEITKALVSEHNQVSFYILNFIRTFDNIVLVIDKVNDLKQVSINLRSCYNKMIEDSCFISFGRTSNVSSLSTTLKDLTTTVDNYATFFQKYTDELKIKANEYSENKDKKIELQPNYTNDSADNNNNNEIDNNYNENQTLTTELSKAFISLPTKFNVPEKQKINVELTSELLNLNIQKHAQKTKESLQLLMSSLSNIENESDQSQISNSLSSFHDSISQFIQTIDRMIDFSWNPIHQRNLSQARDSLINFANSSIVVSRNTILKNKNWESLISSFSKDANDSISNVIRFSQDLVDSEKNDLSTANEAERELVRAAQFVSKTKRKLSDDEKYIINSSNDSVGVSIVDIIQPILLNAAKIIEAARSKIRTIMNKGNKFTNQNAICENAKDLIESLSIIMDAVESNSLNDPKYSSKIFENTKKANNSVVQFLEYTHNL